MTLPNVNFTAGRPVRADELAEIINQDRAKINSLPAANLQKTEAGKVQISITGDAATVGGLTAGEIAGADFAVLAKTLAEMLVNESGLVISGGVASKNSGTANLLDITAIVAIQKDGDGKLDRVELGALTKTTATGSTTYYLDLVPAAVDCSWGTAHATAPYIPIAEVTTDGSGNISTVTDKRPVTVAFFDDLTPEVAEGLELGETSATAYRGDRGATAYAHSQVATGGVHGAVSAATVGTMMVRDASGNVSVADPTAAGHAATKTYADARETSARAYTDAQAALLAPKSISVSSKTSSYTLALADAYTLIQVNSASNLTVTIPPNSSVALPVGTQVLVSRLGAGTVTIVAGSGVTLRAAGSEVALRAQYSMAGLLKIATDTWAVFGDLA